MNSLPQPLWATLLAFQGLLLALAVLYSPGGVDNNIKIGVLSIASALVTGALGAFAGHASADRNSNNKVEIVPPKEAK